MNPVVKGFCSAVRPPDRRPIDRWCEDHVEVDPTSFASGKWRSMTSPWVVPVMLKFQDSSIRTIIVKCSAQSSKTQTIMGCLCWAIAEDPGPAMWVVNAVDEAKQFRRDRLGYTFNHTKPVKEVMIGPDDTDYLFTTMPLYFSGVGSKSKLQGKAIRYLFLDEVRNYKPGRLSMVRKRVRSYSSTSSKEVIISTPGNKKDELDILYHSGSQHVLHVSCPSCNQLQPLVFEQLKWDTNETTKPGGIWRPDEMVKTVRYECKSCGHKIRDTQFERKRLARSCQFVQTNPNAKADIVSFFWNALIPPWVKWGDIVLEFLHARQAIRGGDKEPMKTFVTETLGESWDDELGVIEDFGFLEDRQQVYDYGERWAEEVTRFMAADKQSAGGEHYWYVIRAFAKFGRSRLITYGRCNSYLELEEIRKQYAVPIQNSVIDSGYMANEVYRFCIASGWKPFKGDDNDFFLAKDPKTEKTYQRCWTWSWAKPEGVRPTRGAQRRVRLFRWSNPWTKDLLAEYQMGLVGDWSLPSNVGKDYRKQAISEVREECVDPRGYSHHRWRQVYRDNHLRDCELMIQVAAVISGVIESPARFARAEPKA